MGEAKKTMTNESNENQFHWVLKCNESKKEYHSFEEAKNAFRKCVIDAIGDRDAYIDGVPFSFGAYFSGKHDSCTITDEEIVIVARTRSLLSFLLYRMESEELKSKIRKLIRKTYSYQGVDEFDVEASAQIERNPREITVNLEIDENGDANFLKTNAFLMDDEDKEYFFSAKEMISTSRNREKLGKIISSEISLSKIETLI